MPSIHLYSWFYIFFQQLPDLAFGVNGGSARIFFFKNVFGNEGVVHWFHTAFKKLFNRLFQLRSNFKPIVFRLFGDGNKVVGHEYAIHKWNLKKPFSEGRTFSKFPGPEI